MALFNIELHVHAIPPEALSDLSDLREMLAQILNREGTIMTDVTTLTADVTANTSAVQSAIVLIGNLKTALDAAGTDPVALKALSDQLEASDKALAAAILANTPAAPAGATSTVTGGNGTDTISGGTSTVTGGNGTDTISGGNGTDTISGGTSTTA
jgi:hypothetical protein